MSATSTTARSNSWSPAGRQGAAGVTLIDKEPEKDRTNAGRSPGGYGDALDTLRDLARGIYPQVLADQGLTSAVEAQSERPRSP